MGGLMVLRLPVLERSTTQDTMLCALVSRLLSANDITSLSTHSVPRARPSWFE